MRTYVFVALAAILAAPAFAQVPAPPRWETDHRIAEGDHSLAEQDHGRAEQDQRQAQAANDDARRDRQNAEMDRRAAKDDHKALVEHLERHPLVTELPLKVGAPTLARQALEFGSNAVPKGRPAPLIRALAGCNRNISGIDDQSPFACVRDVGINQIVAYQSISGDREAIANGGAVLTTLGFGGALLGQDHWAHKDTIGWWTAAGAVGLVYDELSGSKPRAHLYGAAARASRMAIFRATEQRNAAARLGPPGAIFLWPTLDERGMAEKTTFSQLSSVCDHLADQATPSDKPAPPAAGHAKPPSKLEAAGAAALKTESTKVGEFKASAAARCLELRKAHASLERIRAIFCPSETSITVRTVVIGEVRKQNVGVTQQAIGSAKDCDQSAALGLADDLADIDDIVASSDRAMRARSSDVAGVVVRSAANVVANLAIKIGQADAAPVGYQGRGLATLGDAQILELNALPDFTPPPPIDDELAIPDIMIDAHNKPGRSGENNYLAKLAWDGMLLNDIRAKLNDDIAVANLARAISKRNKLQFNLTSLSRPVVFAPGS